MGGRYYNTSLHDEIVGKTNYFCEKYGNGRCTEERTKELDNQKNHCTNEADNLTQNWWGAAQFPSSLLLCSKIC